MQQQYNNYNNGGYEQQQQQQQYSNSNMQQQYTNNNGNAGYPQQQQQQMQYGNYPQQQPQQQQYADNNTNSNGGMYNNNQQQQYQPQQMMSPNNNNNNNMQQQAANQQLPPPAATMAMDENGLRWTWSSFPMTAKPKQSALAAYTPANFIGGVSKATSSVTGGAGGAGDHHHIPVTDEMVIPLAAMFTPLHPSEAVVRTASAPQACRQCGAYLSTASQVDLSGGQPYWACPSCLTRNPLPQGFAATDPSLQGSTVEYNCGAPDPSAKQVYIFVIDTAIEIDELDALRKQLLRTIDMMPQDALICCVTFGRGVTVWDLGCDSLNRCYTIRGNRTFAKESVFSATNSVLSAALGGGGAGPGSPTSVGGLHKIDMTTSAGYIRAMLSVHRDNPVTGRFFVPLEECEFALSSIIEELSVDPFPVPTGLRSERATGTALDVGATLLENLVAEGVAVSAKILLFVGGPATRGPGAVVGLHKGQMMRSHRDFLDYNVPMYEKAYEFYNEVEKRLSSIGGSVDCFVASFDQTGIMELRECVNRTGGVFVCGDTFIHEMFDESLQRYFVDRDFSGKKSRAQLEYKQQQNPNGGGENFAPAASGFNATFDIFTSRDTLISGAIGPCRAYIPAAAATTTAANSSALKSPTSPSAATLSAQVGSATRAHLPPILDAAKRVSPIAIGEGNTQRWVASSVDSGVTITFLFDTAVLENGAAAPALQRQRFVQFVTHFTTPNGERRIRVTTVNHHIAPTVDPNYYTNNTTATNHHLAPADPQQLTLNPDGTPMSPQPHQMLGGAIFDQTCAATVVSRMAVSMLEDYAPHMWESSKRWIDKLLVMFVKRFGTYRPMTPDSLRLSSTLSLFPSFMYNLRRSEYFMIMNISPDETVFKRHWLMREGCDCVVLMIQPTLHSYTFAAPYATPVPLDSNSILPDNILVIDCFFNLHIIRGQTIEEWRKLEYHLNPEYQHFADLLAAPDRDTAATLAGRFPYPRFSSADINHGEARHLKTRLNPSSTYATSNGMGGNNQGAVLNTDDASVAKFMQTLKEAVVRTDGNTKVGLSQ